MDEILEYLNRNDLMKYISGWDGKFEIPFDISPSEFIRFAEHDMNEGKQRGFVNSLSNIKRAIDCQIEVLLYVFGYYNKAKKENWSFPKKIDLLKDVGVVAPRVLEKINRKRNQLEHDFKYPALGEVEDFLDVGNLFILYTHRFVKDKWSTFEIETEDDSSWPWCKIYLNYRESRFELNLIKSKGDQIKQAVDISSQHYKFLLRFLIDCIKNS